MPRLRVPPKKPAQLQSNTTRRCGRPSAGTRQRCGLGYGTIAPKTHLHPDRPSATVWRCESLIPNVRLARPSPLLGDPKSPSPTLAAQSGMALNKPSSHDAQLEDLKAFHAAVGTSAQSDGSLAKVCAMPSNPLSTMFGKDAPVLAKGQDPVAHLNALFGHVQS